METVFRPLFERSAAGGRYLEGTRTKVVELALDSLAHHREAGEVRRQHPHLAPGQIHAALAYCDDHREPRDAVIARRLAEADPIAGARRPSLFRGTLKRTGRP